MKTKNKVLAVLEIAVVLCSLFLVALPATAIAAEQDDYILGIYGNANEDDTIDMRDLTYVKLIFFGKKPDTELADAKYDGKINPLDFIQIKLIIVGKGKELTVVDSMDRIVTVNKPIKRIVACNFYVPDSLRLFGALDKLVGVSSSIDEALFPELSNMAKVGSKDYEAILSLNPDLVITWWGVAEAAEKLSGIPVVGLYLYAPHYKNAYLVEELVKFGYIIDKKDDAEWYLDDFHDKYIDHIKERTEKLSDEKRPKVYLEAGGYWGPSYTAHAAGSSAHHILEIAGGRNIFADLQGTPKVDPEAVVVRNPDIIIRQKKGVGYGEDDISEIKALRESIMNRPELANVNAVKNGRVYIMDQNLVWGLDYPIAMAYWAKWIHSDPFEDLDPKAIHQEYLTEFQRFDYDLDKHGVFVYPPPEEWQQ